MSPAPHPAASGTINPLQGYPSAAKFSNLNKGSSRCWMVLGKEEQSTVVLMRKTLLRKRRAAMRQALQAALMIGAASLLAASVWGQEPGIAVELPGGVPLEMVWIEPGTFTMGGEPDLLEDNDVHGPQHTVTLTQGFYFGKFELQQGQWSAVMKTKPWEAFGQADCPACPATWISWEDTQEFLHQLNTQSADSLIYRLPTEAEWEYAARAGTQTAWSFGDDPAELKNYGWYRGITCLDDINDFSECFLHEVGLKLPNPWGLYDIHGNVGEWVRDWWADHYPEGPQTDPLNDKVDGPYPERVIRGGAFSLVAGSSRSGFRTSWPSDEKRFAVGFRIARLETHAIPTTWGAIKENNSPLRLGSNQ